MNSTIKKLENPSASAVRCPGCYHLPDVQFENSGAQVVLECKMHGHMAVGADLDLAIANWNHYIKAVA